MKLASSRKNFNMYFPYSDQSRKEFFVDLVDKITHADAIHGEVCVHCKIILKSGGEINFVGSSANTRIQFKDWMNGNLDNGIAYVIDLQQGRRRLTIAFNSAYVLEEMNIDTPTFEDVHYRRKGFTFIIPSVNELVMSHKGSLIWLSGNRTTYVDFDCNNIHIDNYFRDVFDKDDLGVINLYKAELLNAFMLVNYLKSPMSPINAEFTLREKSALDYLSDFMCLPDHVKEAHSKLNVQKLQDEMENFAIQHFKIYQNALNKLADKGLL